MEFSSVSEGSYDVLCDYWGMEDVDTVGDEANWAQVVMFDYLPPCFEGVGHCGPVARWKPYREEMCHTGEGTICDGIKHAEGNTSMEAVLVKSWDGVVCDEGVSEGMGELVG